MPIVTFDVMGGQTTRRWLDRFTHAAYGRLPYALPMVEALKRVEAQQMSFALQCLPDAATEPVTYARKVEATVEPTPVRTSRARRPRT